VTDGEKFQTICKGATGLREREYGVSWNIGYVWRNYRHVLRLGSLALSSSKSAI
jgi:hypothetical protein